MAPDWIDEGLRREREAEHQQRLRLEHRRDESAVINEKAPRLMQDIVRAIGSAIEEYRRKASVDETELQFEVLPHEGFCVNKITLPRVVLECRPDYDSQVLCCNMTRVDDHASEPVERVFNLAFSVDTSNNIALTKGTRTLQRVDEAVETLLIPVLFPLWAAGSGS